MNEQKAIAIIDSGVGGLTVAREVMRQLPQERILYFGDNARCPYGSRPPGEIRSFSLQMIQFLFQYPVKALVIACNTAAAVVLEEVREFTAVPVLGVIEPGARAAISASRTGRIGIIGTETTIRTAAYERALRRINPNLYVAGLACPQFVPLVENRLIHTPEAERIVAETLAPLKYEELDTLILGCTHYPLLAPLIQKALGDEITLISSAEETARELSTLLSLSDMHAPAQWDQPRHQFFTSGEIEVFRQIGEEWLGCPVNVEHRVLEPSVPIK
ncbi:glutamate racemase [Brevibacillus sp. SYP-B805]|uniref:glutamate racemase n=1 Tax=Brevibacillus sp. SYP-B805 TaxID=1578199 RepID=UPI0013ED93DE|nr:glutamate racemase [Brevibacillus sp. SYP-B805]NGQ94384.1 glutamate racemase [Brevibacillus sp. SYP-B805]